MAYIYDIVINKLNSLKLVIGIGYFNLCKDIIDILFITKVKNKIIIINC